MGIVLDTYHSLEGLALGDTRAPLVICIIFDIYEGDGKIAFDIKKKTSQCFILQGL